MWSQTVPMPPGKNTEQDVMKQKITMISSTSTPPIKSMWAWVEASCAALAAAALAFLAAALRDAVGRAAAHLASGFSGVIAGLDLLPLLPAGDGVGCGLFGLFLPMQRRMLALSAALSSFSAFL